jgi:hypothetical protein
MLPTALAYAMLMGGSILVLDQLGMRWGTAYGLVLTAISGVATFAFVFFLDRGRTISGAAAGTPSQRGQRPSISATASAPAGD